MSKKIATLPVYVNTKQNVRFKLNILIFHKDVLRAEKHDAEASLPMILRANSSHENKVILNIASDHKFLATDYFKMPSSIKRICTPV